MEGDKKCRQRENFYHHFCVRDMNNDIIIRTGVVSTKSTMSYNKRNNFIIIRWQKKVQKIVPKKNGDRISHTHGI